MITEDKDNLYEVKYKAFEAKVLLRYNLSGVKKPKLLDSYLDKVARVLGVNRDKSSIDSSND